jgi:hypothetical protein
MTRDELGSRLLYIYGHKIFAVYQEKHVTNLGREYDAMTQVSHSKLQTAKLVHARNVKRRMSQDFFLKFYILSGMYQTFKDILAIGVILFIFFFSFKAKSNCIIILLTRLCQWVWHSRD